jgi:uncharacterized protein
MATRFWEAGTGRRFIGRLETGSDLVGEIEALAEREGIRAGWVSVVGAMQAAVFAYYNQQALRYDHLASERHHELCSFQGNLSIRDGSPFLHAHASFADHDGNMVGGHLLPGCTVWVAEVQVQELTDVELLRTHDEVTGLALW